MGWQTAQAMERDELQQKRRQGGAWLKNLREEAGLSQRELATLVGADYYSFVSQIEAGKGRVPVAQVELWAKALRVSRPVFAKGLLKFYDPITYDMLFGEEGTIAPVETDPLLAPAVPPSPSAPAQVLAAASSARAQPARPANDFEGGVEVDDDLRARINRIEAILMMRGATS